MKFILTDLEAVFCPWRNCWVAYDTNHEPDENGLWCNPFGEGKTREEALAELIQQLEDAE